MVLSGWSTETSLHAGVLLLAGLCQIIWVMTWKDQMDHPIILLHM
jgi:hypothetical protein